VWEHGDNCSWANLDSTFEQAHSCPECGTFQNRKYYGAEEPQHVGECVLGEGEYYIDRVADRFAEGLWTA
jgi:hypothetical protein